MEEQQKLVVKKEIKQIWAVAWPLILSNILNVAVGLADLKMVGVLGVEAIAAVGMSRQVMMFILVFMLAVSGGASILVAHAYGAKDKRQVSIISARSITFMLLLAVLFVTPVGFFFSYHILLIIGAEADVIQLGDVYLKLLFAGSIFTMFNFVVNGILLGVGKTKVSFLLLLSVNIVNIFLNYTFIFGVGFIPPMGVMGAALGTVIARALGALAGIWILKTRHLPIQIRFRDGFKLDFSLLGKIFFLGGPRSLQGIIRNFSRLMAIKILSLLPDSTRAISAYSVTMQVKMISSFVGLSFMSAAMARVGQNLGAGNKQLARKSGWLSAVIASGLMACMALLFLLFPDYIMLFFTEDSEVIKMGIYFFMIVALTEPVEAFSFSLSGALRARGDPISPFLYASFSDLIILLGISYLGVVIFKLGFLSIAIGFAVSAFTRTIPMVIKYHNSKWQSLQFIKHDS